LIALVFLLVCGGLGLRLGTEFLPKLEEGNLWIRALLPPTITLDAGRETVDKIRAIIASYPPVKTVVSEQGRGDDATDPDGSFVAEFFVPLKPFEEWPDGLTKAQLVKDIANRLEGEFIGIDFNFSQYIQDNIEEAVSGVKGENSVKIFGRRDNSRMADFYNRRALGVGAFITRADIERRNAARASDLLRTIAGVRVNQGDAFDRPVVEMGRTAVRLPTRAGSKEQSLAGDCRVNYYLDGNWMPPGTFHIDDLSPSLIEGIEIYRGPSEIPARFRQRETACGLIHLDAGTTPEERPLAEPRARRHAVRY